MSSSSEAGASQSAAHQKLLLILQELCGDSAGDRGDVPHVQPAPALPQHRGVHPQVRLSRS